MSMSTQPAAQSSNHPLGTGGDHRRRLILHHVPLALASTIAFVLWMTLPLFQVAHHAREGHDHAEGADSAASPPRALQHAARAAGHHGPHEAGGHRRPWQERRHEDSPQAAGDVPTDQAGHKTRNLDRLQDRAFMARVTTATGYIALGLSSRSPS